MKSLTIFLSTLFFCLFATEAEAGIKKGNYLIGGHGKFETRSVFDDLEASTAQEFLLNPVYASFIRDNLAIGPTFIWSYRLEDEFDEARSRLQIGPFIRFYTGVNLFFETSVKYDRYSNEFGTTSHSIFVGTAMGYSVKLLDRFMFEPRGYIDFGLRDPMEVYSGLTIGFTGLLQSAGEKGED